MIPAFRRGAADDLPGSIRRVSLRRFSNDRCAGIRERLLRYILLNEHRRVSARRGLSNDGGRRS